jgi:hypothetical protein
MLVLILIPGAMLSQELLVNIGAPSAAGDAAARHGTSMARVTSVWRWSHSARVKASLTSARGYW